jgi:transposase
MIKWSKDLQVHLYSDFVDMRKQMDGLLMIIQEHIPESPKPDTLYLFYNRHLDKVKCLLWDNNGFILIYKRLEKSRFKLSEITEDLQITPQQLEWLLAGYDFVQLQQDTKLPYIEYL